MNFPLKTTEEETIWEEDGGEREREEFMRKNSGGRNKQTTGGRHGEALDDATRKVDICRRIQSARCVSGSGQRRRRTTKKSKIALRKRRFHLRRRFTLLHREPPLTSVMPSPFTPPNNSPTFSPNSNLIHKLTPHNPDFPVEPPIGQTAQDYQKLTGGEMGWGLWGFLQPGVLLQNPKYRRSFISQNNYRRRLILQTLLHHSNGQPNPIQCLDSSPPEAGGLPGFRHRLQNGVGFDFALHCHLLLIQADVIRLHTFHFAQNPLHCAHTALAGHGNLEHDSLRHVYEEEEEEEGEETGGRRERESGRWSFIGESRDGSDSDYPFVWR